MMIQPPDEKLVTSRLQQSQRQLVPMHDDELEVRDSKAESHLQGRIPRWLHADNRCRVL